MLKNRIRAYISVYDYDKSNEYRKVCELIIKFGTNVVKVLPEDRIDANQSGEQNKMPDEEISVLYPVHSL